jgi:hypothetical protein
MMGNNHLHQHVDEQLLMFLFYGLFDRVVQQIALEKEVGGGAVPT